MSTQDAVLLKVAEAARRLSLSRNKVYELIHEGRLGFVKVDSTYRVPARAIDEFIERAGLGTTDGPAAA